MFVLIILCGVNDFMCDEMECFLYDVFCVVKRVLELKFVVFGGGVVEVVFFIYFENYVISMGFWE